MRGEGFDLLVVPDPDRPVTERDTRRRCLTVLKDIGQPRRVTLVERIPGTSTGKLRLEELRQKDFRP